MFLDKIQKPSPHHGSRNGHRVRAVVVHIIGGKTGSMESCISWFQNPASKVSSHWGVDQEGRIYQFVSTERAAWANGRVDRPDWPLLVPGANPNWYTESIEHEGREDSPWTDAMYAASAALIAERLKANGLTPGDDTIVEHRRIFRGKSCPGHMVDMRKLRAMAAAIWRNL